MLLADLHDERGVVAQPHLVGDLGAKEQLALDLPVQDLPVGGGHEGAVDVGKEVGARAVVG
eukprot:8131861-Alexandrium_andersonii.AAC.1